MDDDELKNAVDICEHGNLCEVTPPRVRAGCIPLTTEDFVKFVRGYKMKCGCSCTISVEYGEHGTVWSVYKAMDGSVRVLHWTDHIGPHPNVDDFQMENIIELKVGLLLPEICAKRKSDEEHHLLLDTVKKMRKGNWRTSLLKFWSLPNFGVSIDDVAKRAICCYCGSSPSSSKMAIQHFKTPVNIVKCSHQDTLAAPCYIPGLSIDRYIIPDLVSAYNIGFVVARVIISVTEVVDANEIGKNEPPSVNLDIVNDDGMTVARWQHVDSVYHYYGVKQITRCPFGRVKQIRDDVYVLI